MQNARSSSAKIIGIVAALAALALCGQTSGCQQQAQMDIGTAIAVGCPIVTGLQNSAVKLSTPQAAALTTLQAVCANPPTSVGAASADVVQAIVILEPVLTAALAAKH